MDIWFQCSRMNLEPEMRGGNGSLGRFLGCRTCQEMSEGIIGVGFEDWAYSIRNDSGGRRRMRGERWISTRELRRGGGVWAA
jgi:hypothetical protein